MTSELALIPHSDTGTSLRLTHGSLTPPESLARRSAPAATVTVWRTDTLCHQSVTSAHGILRQLDWLESPGGRVWNPSIANVRHYTLASTSLQVNLMEKEACRKLACSSCARLCWA